MTRQTRRFGAVSAGTLILAWTLAACDDWGVEAPAEWGRVRVQLAVPGRVTLSEVSYELSRRGQSVLSDTVALSGQQRTFSLRDVPGGWGYALEATALGEGVLCKGRSSAALTVVPGRTTRVRVPLRCEDTALDEVGSIAVSGSFNFCPRAPALVVPAQLSVAASTELVATSSDPDGDEVTFAWEASSGTLEELGPGRVRFTCAEPGEAQVSVVADDATGCDVATDVQIRCDAPEA